MFKFILASIERNRSLLKLLLIIVFSQPVAFGQTEGPAKSELEQQLEQAREQVKSTIIPEAIEAINETKKAISYLANKQNKEGLAAIERATGKIDILLARHPEKAILPVDIKVKVIDLAPLELRAIREIGKAAEKAIQDKNYPDSRNLLNGLQSQININTYHLPLAIYLTGLERAAKLLEQKNNNEAKEVLIAALNTLVVVNQTISIPIINAKDLLRKAEELYKKNGDHKTALDFIDKAKLELERSKELGYTRTAGEYGDLDKSTMNLKKLINQNKDTTFAFVALKNKLTAFIKLLSEIRNQYPEFEEIMD